MKTSLKFLFPAIPIVLSLLCAQSEGQDALQQFRKMQNALGSADKISAIRDYEQIVHADAWDFAGNAMGVVRKRVRFVRPSYLRVDQVGQRDTYVLYFDGKSGWEILPDGTVADLKGDELTFAHNYLYGFDLNIWLADRDPRYAIGSPAANVVSITAKDNSFPGTEITLDPASYLPVKETGVQHPDADHPASDETRLGQWQVVQGVKFPGLITKLRNGKKLAEITVEQTKLNGGLKAADLAIKPSDKKPVMSQ
jgi:hypothetical protein